MEHMRLPLQASILQVTSSDPNKNEFGTAFAIARNGATTYLATCAHVIRDVGGEGQVMVNSIPARVVVPGSPDGPEDVAVLETELPVGVMPIGLESYFIRERIPVTTTESRRISLIFSA